MSNWKIVLSFGLAGAVVLSLSLWAPGESGPSQGDKPFKPVQPIEHMMGGQKKLFGEIKLAIGEKDWDETETCAWILAEIANANHYQRDDATYQRFADQLSAQSVELAGLAKKRDEAKAKEMVNSMGKTCNACHDQFQKKK
jgi:hypothetical protein